MSDLEKQLPALVHDVKIERISEEESEDESSQFVTQYVPIKHRVIYDMHPKTADIYQSEWPKFWLREVESCFKLQKAEAAKNEDFYGDKIRLLNHALKVEK